MDGPGQNFVQDLFGGAPELDVPGGQVFALGRLDEVDFLERQSLLLGKTERRAGRRADGVVGHGFWRSGDFAGDVRLRGLQATQPCD